MKVEAIHLRAPDANDVHATTSAKAVAGKGLEGDRYFFEDGARPGLALTLIEGDVVRGAGLAEGATRRQVTVTGTGLNDLVGKRFRVGAVECEGVQLCEPCNHLQGLTQPGVLRGLVHRAGLRAEVLEGGTIAPGDVVRPA